MASYSCARAAASIRFWLLCCLAAAGMAAAPPAVLAGREPPDSKGPARSASERRSASVLDPAVTQVLEQAGRAVVWVHLSDRGERDASDLARMLARVRAPISARSRERRARYHEGRFVHDLSDLPVHGPYVRGIEAAGARLRRASRFLNAVSVETDEEGARRIADLSYVDRITRVMPTEPGLAPPGAYGLSEGQNQGVHSIAAHDSGYSGAGVVVAVLDTGFRKDHASLAPLKRIAEWDFVDSDEETANEAGEDDPEQWRHGTGVWSIFGGYQPGALVGPAYNASFVLAKTHDIWRGTHEDEDLWVAAAEWADSIGVDILSSSMVAGYPASALDGSTTPMARATNTLKRHGVLVVTAMGNSGPGLQTLWTPSDCDSTLAVGSVDASNALSSYSSRGPTLDGRGKPDLVAQGEVTRWADPSCITCTTSFYGTSLATPLVGGVAALVQEAHPDWNAQQVRYALKSTADKAPSPDSTSYGWGRPNAVQAIYGSTLGPPVFPKPFALVAPDSQTTVTSDSILFRWRRALDLTPGDAVQYQLDVRNVLSGVVVSTASTADTFHLHTAGLEGSTLYEWTITATDLMGHVRRCLEPFRFTTPETPDRPPVVTAPASHTGFAGRENSFLVTAVDPDGDAISSLTVDVSGLPPGSEAVFTPDSTFTSGVFTWYSTPADTGSHSVSFLAANALSGSAVTSILLGTPLLLAAADQVAASEGAPIEITATATDPDDSRTLTITASGGPPGLMFSHSPSVSPSTATLSGMLTQEDAVSSPHTIQWSVSDGAGGTAIATTILHVSTVTAVPDATPSTGPPRVLALGSRPNPFQTSTRIEFRVEGALPSGVLAVRIYDVHGRSIRTLLERSSWASGSVRWDGRNDAGVRMAAGVYHFRIEAGSTRVTRRLVLLR